MEFLEKLFEKHGDRPHSPQDTHSRYAARPPWEASHGDPRYAHASEHESGEQHAYRGDPHRRSMLQGVLGALGKFKTLLVVAALLFLVVAIGGVVGLVLLIPLIGKLLAAVGGAAGGQDLSALLTDMPRLLSTLLVDLPKAVLDYLGPLLQLKTTLEGKG